MAETPTEYLDRVTALFTAAFESAAVVNRDDRPDRCLLEMTGQYGIRQSEHRTRPRNNVRRFHRMGRVEFGMTGDWQPEIRKLAEW